MGLLYLLRIKHIDCNSTITYTASMRNVVVKNDERTEHIRTGVHKFSKNLRSHLKILGAQKGVVQRTHKYYVPPQEIYSPGRSAVWDLCTSGILHQHSEFFKKAS
jgi:hypothetical protein